MSDRNAPDLIGENLPNGIYYQILCQYNKRFSLLAFTEDTLLPFIAPIQKGKYFGAAVGGLLCATGIGYLVGGLASDEIEHRMNKRAAKALNDVCKDLDSIRNAVGNNAINYQNIKNIAIETINNTTDNNIRIYITDTSNQLHGPWLTFRRLNDGAPFDILSKWLAKIWESIGKELPATIYIDKT